MRKLNYYLAAACMLLSLNATFTSCSDDDTAIDDPIHPTFKVGVELTAPQGIESLTYTQLEASITDKATLEVVKKDLLSLGQKLDLIAGLYDISIEGKATYTVGETQKEVNVRGEVQSVEVKAGTTPSFTIPMTLVDIHSGFVLAEIFISGNLTPEGETYMGDSFFRIYNNSAETLDAQGLILCESAMQSDMMNDYFVLDQFDVKREDIVQGSGTKFDTYKATHSISDATYMVPVGTPVLVAPGESLLIGDVGKNHTVDNANSWDFSGFNYEWYDDNEWYPDVQTAVTDLTKLYCSSFTIWMPHSRAVKSYFIAQKPNDVTVKQFLADRGITYYYVYPANKRTMPFAGYSIPNEWILDAVNISNETDYKWSYMSSSLDKSYAHIATSSDDASAMNGKSVRRKVLSGKFLLDTNDSAHDFENGVRANPFYKFHE